MTLEDFFLEDYEKLRKRVKELESELERMNPSRYGIVDLGESCELVRVSVGGSYSLYDGETKANYIEEVMKKDDGGLLEWAMSKKLGYYDHPITISRQTLPFTVQTTTLTSTERYATDGCSTYERIDSIEDEMVDNLGAWCLPEYEDALISAAVEELRYQLEKVHIILEQREKESEEE